MAEQVGVGLVGLGTVGSAVARRLIDEWELLGVRAGAVPVLRRAAVRDVARPRRVDLRTAVLDADPQALVDDERVQVIVEVMGGVDRAAALIERALRARKPVVTANKAAMSAHGLELAALAREAGVSLRYEAAVGAGLPIVALLRDSLRGDRIGALTMIINGTTNVILTAMARQGATLAAALRDAQERGYAEADPSADVDGEDAASKLVLLSRLAFDVPLGRGDVDVTGIGRVEAVDIECARALGCSLKLVASAVAGGGGVALRVAPSLLPAGHPLHGVDDSDNAVVVESDLAGTVVLAGPGAGGDSTASAVVSDIVATVRDPHAAPPRPAGVVQGTAAAERGAYLRVALTGVDDAAALVVQALEDRGLDVRGSTTAGTSQLAAVTAPATREELANAVGTLDSHPAVDRVVAVFDAL